MDEQDGRASLEQTPSLSAGEEAYATPPRGSMLCSRKITRSLCRSEIYSFQFPRRGQAVGSCLQPALPPSGPDGEHPQCRGGKLIEVQ
jgi:hypothetical protein